MFGHPGQAVDGVRIEGAYHAYPWLIHRLTYHRSKHDNIHVRGCKEDGTVTTPFCSKPERPTP